MADRERVTPDSRRRLPRVKVDVVVMVVLVVTISGSLLVTACRDGF